MNPQTPAFPGLSSPRDLPALQSDVAANAREDAAETLENYRDSPDVRQALELAAQSDADEKVRR